MRQDLTARMIHAPRRAIPIAQTQRNGARESPKEQTW
jgi:hypothetical protein